VATAAPSDEEMVERIAHHRARRPAAWRTIEARTDLASHLPSDVATLLVEDLTLLLSNHMESDPEEAEARTIEEVNALLSLSENVVLVSNEVGMGLVPTSALGRQFRDALGRVNQAAAAMCTEVYLVIAGLPVRLK
jgi:adenosylcobinamide kinase/adenosylcobinamide-phosphate guanylyltransferase